jgi:hypothetical protein
MFPIDSFLRGLAIDNKHREIMPGLIPFHNYRIPGLTPIYRQPQDVDLPRFSSQAQVSNIGASINDEGKLVVSMTYDADAFVCCVCQEKIVGKVFSCESNHSLCYVCQGQLSEIKCPVCRSTIRYRNFVLEMALKKLIVCCKFDGCHFEGYPDTFAQHEAECLHCEIQCPWCPCSTTTDKFSSHVIVDCKTTFTELECSSNIGFSLKNKSNAFMVSNIDRSRTLFMEKNKQCVRLLCLQTSESVDGLDTIGISCVLPVAPFEDKQLSKIINSPIPIHTSRNLIAGKISWFIITKKKLNSYSSIHITGFEDKYVVGSRWEVLDVDSKWYSAKVVKRSHVPSMVLFKFDISPDDHFDEWIELKNESSDRIRQIEQGRTYDQQTVERIESMSEDEQMRMALERSMDEH